MMNDVPLVSVILPNYNHAPYLRQRIESILQQTFSGFELIILDDCSTDNSREILSLYQTHPKVTHFILNEQNSGSTFKQWNKGLELARGTYVWIAESDDFADSTFLEKTVGELVKNKDAVLVYTGSHMVDAEGCTMPLDWDHFHEKSSMSTLFDGKNFVQTKMLYKNSIYNASMVVFRKSCYFRISDIYKRFRYCGDWIFWGEMGIQGDVIRINRKLNYFRQHLNKVSVGAEKEGLTFIEGCSVISALSDKLNLSLYERLVVSGKLRNHLYRRKRQDRKFCIQILADNRHLFIGGRWAVVVYAWNKLVVRVKKILPLCTF